MERNRKQEEQQEEEEEINAAGYKERERAG